MLGVPVEILSTQDPGKADQLELLGDRFSVAYTPSCSVLGELTRRQDRPVGLPALFAVQDPDRLRFSKYKVGAVADRFDDSMILSASQEAESELYKLSDQAGFPAMRLSCSRRMPIPTRWTLANASWSSPATTPRPTRRAQMDGSASRRLRGSIFPRASWY